MPHDPPLSIRVRCARPGCRAWVPAPVASPGSVEARCPACGDTRALTLSDALAARREVTDCPACGGREFFIRKDFPQRLGLLLVIAFGLAASVFYYYENIVATFGTLFALVAIDAVIYFFVGKVTVCYKCRAEYRGVVYNPNHQPFDLATSEKYAHP